MRRFAVVAIVLVVGGASVAIAQTAGQTKLAPVEAPAGVQTASVDLGAEFPQMKGYVFAQSLTTVQPGTGRALHTHASKPEIVRILSGTLTEVRNGGAPVAYGPGSTLVNAAGAQHMWANLGTEPVVFVATVIRPAK
jgi:quercetin dioxygenase-like cupin family protein